MTTELRADSVVASPPADPQVLLWTLPVAYAMHVLEEFAFNWAAWAQRQGLDFGWNDFLLTNGAVLVFGACAAAIGYRKPSLSLAFPVLMVVNALLFHLLPTVVLSRPNPGFITALVLFLPLGGKALADARRLAVRWTELLLALGLAVVAQAFPLLLLALRERMAWA